MCRDLSLCLCLYGVAGNGAHQKEPNNIYHRMEVYSQFDDVIQRCLCAFVCAQFEAFARLNQTYHIQPAKIHLYMSSRYCIRCREWKFTTALCLTLKLLCNCVCVCAQVVKHINRSPLFLIEMMLYAASWIRNTFMLEQAKNEHFAIPKRVVLIRVFANHERKGRPAFNIINGKIGIRN